MRRNTVSLAAASATIGLIASGCGGSPTAESKTTEATTTATSASSSPVAAATSTSPAAPALDSAQLQALVPAPAGTTQTNGPDTIPNNGIHMKFVVNGSPTDVVGAYKSALAGKGWTVTTIVSSAGGEGGGGGATYTGTHGDSYGVFDGGGYANNTYVNVCVWPTKPADPNCTRAD